MAWVLVIVGVLLGAGGLMDLKRPIPKQQEQDKAGTRTSAIVMFGFGVLLAFAGLIDLAPGRSTAGATPATGAKENPKQDVGEAWVMCQEFVNDKLMSPASAKYPAGTGKDYVTYLSTGQYRFKAYVDSHNAVGVMLRTKFDCTVSNTGPDKWRLDSLAME